ncbi:MAG: leucine-rich repeat domain-containing protein, partial [Proteobacteria bacterium]|nr:leucine-rich repeat domain-containing protein [Pseudomonadota bacterium]
MKSTFKSLLLLILLGTVLATCDTEKEGVILTKVKEVKPTKKERVVLPMDKRSALEMCLEPRDGQIAVFKIMAKKTRMQFISSESQCDSLIQTYKKATSFYLSNNLESITDLSPLKEFVNLQSITLAHVDVPDLTPLKGLVNLKEIYINEVSIDDISLLAGMPNLESITIENTSVSDLKPLQKLTKLKIVMLYDNQITSINPLKHLSELRKVKIGDSNIKSLAPLKNLQKLELVEASYSKISELGDQWYRENPKNMHIYLLDNQITDISALKGLKNLEFLNLDKNRIEDLSPLTGLTRLKELSAKKNRIKNLGTLEGLDNLEKM